MKDLPEGWVRVSQYDERDDKNAGGPQGDYARILAAIKLKPSPIRSYKDGKCWAAFEEDVKEFLSTVKACAEPDASRVASVRAAASHMVDTRHAESVCKSLSSIDATLDEIYRVFERLTLAVESMATQPKTAHDRLVATVESNGFHN